MADKTLQVVLELVDKASAQLKQVSGSFENAAATAKKVGAGMTVAGGAITAFGAASVKAFQEQESAEARLAQIAGQVTGSTQEQIDGFKQLASELQSVGVVGDEVLIAGQSQIASFTKSSEVVAELSDDIADLAVAQYGANVSQDQAIQTANLLGKAMSGQLGALTRAGILVGDDLKKAFEEANTEEERAAVLSQIVQDNYGGLNAAARETSEGGMQALKNSFGDLMETMGEVISNALIPIVEHIEPIIAQIQTWADENPQLFQTIVTIVAALGALMLVLGPILVILPTLIAGFSAAATVIGLLFSPITLIVLAIGGLIAAIVFLIANWEAVKQKVTEVWENMKNTITEKIEKIKSDISAWWDNIKSKFNEALETLKGWWETAWQFMLDHIGVIMGALFAVSTGGMSLILGWFFDNRDKIVNAIAGVWDVVKDKAVGAFNGIKDALRGTMQFILGKVNKFIGGLNNVLSKVPGVDLAIPTLPAFAEGGIVTKPTVGLIGEAGTEAVIPLSKAGKMGFGGGTTININWTGAVDERAAEMVAKEVSRILDIEGRNSIQFGNA